MIGYLNGKITHLYSDFCFVDVHGVGYRVFISSATRQELGVNSTVTLYTYLNVREDALLIYGFYTKDEYDLFQHLISITGIGPKVALGVLSAIRADEFRAAVSQKNAALLTRIPGIGKKTAERMILELKDKLGMPEGIALPAVKETLGRDVPQDSFQEALSALVSLGYGQSEAGAVLSRVNAEGLAVQDLIKLALKELSRR